MKEFLKYSVGYTPCIYPKDFVNDTTKSYDSLDENSLIKIGRPSSVNPEIVSQYTERLSMLANDDTKLLQQVRSNNSLLSDFQNNIACLVDAILEENTINSRKKIRNWFRKFRPDTSDEIYSFYEASFGPATDNHLFLVKTAKNPTINDLRHEAIASFFVLNSLRKFVPNFAFVYGYTECSPVISSDEELISWCESSTPSTSYLFTERITDGVRFDKWLTTCSYNDFLIVFFQLINALAFANAKFGFVNYLLWYFNIFVRDVSTPSSDFLSIPIYDFETTELIGSVSTKYVAFVRNFENSEFRVGTDLLRNDIVSEVYESQGYGVIDLYQVIVTTFNAINGKELVTEYDKKISSLERFFGFFDEDIKIVGSETNSHYQVNERHFRKTYQQFKEMFREDFESVFVNIGREPVQRTVVVDFSEKFGSCDFLKAFEQDVFIRNQVEYINMIESVQKDTKRSEQDKRKLLKAINTSFNSDAYFRQNIEQMTNLVAVVLDKMEELSERIEIPEGLPLQPEEFVSKNLEYMKALMKAKNVFYVVRDFLQNSKIAFDLQGMRNDDSRKFIKTLSEKNMLIIGMINKKIEEARNLFDYIDEILITNSETINIPRIQELTNILLAFVPI